MPSMAHSGLNRITAYTKSFLSNTKISFSLPMFFFVYKFHFSTQISTAEYRVRPPRYISGDIPRDFAG